LGWPEDQRASSWRPAGARMSRWAMGIGQLDDSARLHTRRVTVTRLAAGASSSCSSVANPKQGCPVCPVRQTTPTRPRSNPRFTVPHSSLRHDLCRSTSLMRNCAPWDPATLGWSRRPALDDYWIRSYAVGINHAYRHQEHPPPWSCGCLKRPYLGPGGAHAAATPAQTDARSDAISVAIDVARRRASKR
jgi:hypothetical protein